MSRERRELYEFGDFRLDVGEHRLERLDGSSTGSLPDKAFQTLVHLVRNSGTLITKEELLSVVWPDTIVEENNLGKAVYAIRHYFGEKTGEHRYIETVPKHGYRFVAEVRRIDAADSPPQKAVDQLPAARKHPGGILGIPSPESNVIRESRFRTAFEAVQLARIRYSQMTAPTTLEARATISEALWLDPEFAPAYSLSAEVTTLEVIVGIKRPDEGFAEARAAIARARELGADSEDFYAAAGYVELIADWDFASAEKNLRKALSINPHYGPANRMLGETYMFQGCHDEASVYVNRAQVDELTGIHSLNILAISRFLARRYPAVIEVCDRMLALSPRHIIPAWTKCWAFEQMGRVDEAIAGYEKILKLPHGEPVLRWIGYAYAVAGDRMRALETAGRLETAAMEHNLSPTHAAAIFAALGEPGNALPHLEKALEMHDPFMLWIATDPRFDNLRGDARFDAIVGQVLEKRTLVPGEVVSDVAGGVKAAPVRVPEPRITESGQHALVDLADWQTVLERLNPKIGSSAPVLGPNDQPAIGESSFESAARAPEGERGLPAAEPDERRLNGRRNSSRWFVPLGAILLLAAAIVGVRYWPTGPQDGPLTISQRRLTVKGGATRAAISQDGRYAAVVQNSELVLFDLQTGEDRLILPASADTRIVTLAFGPGDSSIYFGTRPADGSLVTLFSVPIGGEPTKILDDIYGSLSFSPDGSKFAFVRRYPELNEFTLLTADSDGSNISKLASSQLPNRFDAYPVWSPDGRKIACPAISVEGGFHFTVALVDVETGTVGFVPEQRWTTLSSLVWLSDSRRIVLAGQDEKSVNAQVWQLDTATGQAGRLTNDLFVYEMISGTPDGTSIVAVKVRQSSHVWMLGERQIQLTAGFDNHDGVGGLAWAPDGSILYHSRASGHDAVWRMRADGSGAAEITPDAAGGFAVSPDGQLLVFQGKQSTDHLGLQILDLRDGTVRSLTQNVTALTPAFFPDGKKVAFSLYDKKHSLYEIAVSGGQPKLLSDEFRTATAPSVSPSGKFAAFAMSRMQTGNLQPGISIIASDTRKVVSTFPVRITIGSFYQEPTVQWSSDESEVYFIQLEGAVSNIVKLRLSDGTVSNVTNFADGRIFNFAVEPGGKRMLIARGLLERDATLLRIDPPL